MLPHKLSDIKFYIHSVSIKYLQSIFHVSIKCPFLMELLHAYFNDLKNNCLLQILTPKAGTRFSRDVRSVI